MIHLLSDDSLLVFLIQIELYIGLLFVMFTTPLKSLYPKLLYLLKCLNLEHSEGLPIIPHKSCWVLYAHCLELLTTRKLRVYFRCMAAQTYTVSTFIPSCGHVGGWWEFGGHISLHGYSVKSEKSFLNLVQPQRGNYWTTMKGLSGVRLVPGLSGLESAFSKHQVPHVHSFLHPFSPRPPLG